MKEEKDTLKNKRIIVVDDEPDILSTIEDILDDCILDKAADFETACDFLKDHIYDAAIIDIMGVNGYELLRMTTDKNIPTIMLTAHALSPQDLVRSVKGGAGAYLPKEKLIDIRSFVSNLIDEEMTGKTKFGKWFSRLESYFDQKFGPYWKEKAEEDETFWM